MEEVIAKTGDASNASIAFDLQLQRHSEKRRVRNTIGSVFLVNQQHNVMRNLSLEGTSNFAKDHGFFKQFCVAS